VVAVSPPVGALPDPVVELATLPLAVPPVVVPGPEPTPTPPPVVPTPDVESVPAPVPVEPELALVLEVVEVLDVAPVPAAAPPPGGSGCELSLVEDPHAQSNVASGTQYLIRAFMRPPSRALLCTARATAFLCHAPRSAAYLGGF
jgi:hypothetical protein